MSHWKRKMAQLQSFKGIFVSSYLLESTVHINVVYMKDETLDCESEQTNKQFIFHPLSETQILLKSWFMKCISVGYLYTRKLYWAVFIFIYVGKIIMYTSNYILNIYLMDEKILNEIIV